MSNLNTIDDQTINFFAAKPISQDIVFYASGGVEMVRLTPDGFYVRGVKLEQDKSEARSVFDGMREFLAGWQTQGR